MVESKSSIDEPKNEKPIVFIIGSTASGKTKLSIELAKQFKNFEIVNADALQIYKGADIMTAKATEEEKAIVPHHLLDIVDLSVKDFNRINYYTLAAPTVDDIQKRNKIPLVVGGSHYYIETLLFSDYEGSGEEEITFNQTAQIQNPDKLKEFEEWRKQETNKKYEQLSEIDPIIAARIHPNDIKRIDNYMKIYIEEDILPSKKILQMNEKRKAKFSNPLILWVKFKEKVKLNEKIADRVVEMLDEKGIKEILEVLSNMQSLGTIDFANGALQSLGYKEFQEFYNRLKEDLAKDIQDQKVPKEVGLIQYFGQKQKVKNLSPAAQGAFEMGKNLLIQKTQKFAKKQLTWIKNRIANDTNILKPRIFQFEFDSKETYGEQVLDKAKEVFQQYIENKLPKLTEPQDQNNLKNETLINWKKFYCECCKTYSNGNSEWQIHLTSRRHQKVTKYDMKQNKKIEQQIKAVDHQKEEEKAQGKD